MSETSDRIRKEFAANDAERDKGLVTPKDIVRWDNIVFDKQNPCQKLDVYRPASAEGKKLPVIISVHGGGWVYGDKELYQHYCMNLAQRGFAVVNFTYRLAPESKFPAQLEDINTVVSWTLTHAEAYDMDADAVFAVGDSAGAHLLALYTALCVNPDFRATYGFLPPDGFVPRAVGLMFGVYNIKDKQQQGDTGALLADLLTGGGTPEEIMQISPLQWITENYPPVFIATANEDFVRTESLYLAQALVHNSVPFTFRYYGTKQHPLGHVFHCNVRSAAANQCNDETCRFFREHLPGSENAG